MCDLMGPWYKDTRWPAIWWNLNTQMLYSPSPVANRLEMAETGYPLDASDHYM